MVAGLDNVSGTALVANTTVSGNTATNSGGGIWHNSIGAATLEIANSILLGNDAGASPELSRGPNISEQGGNIIGATFSIDGVDQGVSFALDDVFAEIDPGTGGGQLADNGGSVETIALKLDDANPAVNAGDLNELPADAQDLDGDGDTAEPLPLDANGNARVSGAGLDLGAVEAKEAASLVVTTSADDIDDEDGETSLREAIAAVNDGVLTGTITSDAGVFNGEPEDIIRLTSGETLVITGDVAIDGDIDGDGTADITVSGDADGDDAPTTDAFGNTITDVFNNTNTSDNVRVFDILGGATATLKGLVITGGVAGDGGGVLNTGNLTLTNASVSGNNASNDGGGIQNRGQLSLANVTLADNTATSFGGGLSNAERANVANTTVTGNNADSGGGILNQGQLSLANVTLADNTATNFGGGLVNADGTARVANATVTGNTADDGGGIWNDGTLETANSIVLGNDAPSGGELVGARTEEGGNIIGATFSIDGVDQGVSFTIDDVFATIDPVTDGGQLADNGGPVETILLKFDAANPALDTGDGTELPTETDLGVDVDGDGTLENTPISVDARGLEGSVDVPGVGGSGDTALDLGALELQLAEATEPASLVVTTAEDVVDAFDLETSLREAIAAVNDGVLTGTITFDASVFNGEPEDIIRLTSGETLVITDDVAIDGDIDGDGTADIIVSGDGNGDDATTTDPFGNAITDVFNNTNTSDNVRVFFIEGGATATLAGLVITGGIASEGGGIRLQPNATATIDAAVIAGNAADNAGGGADIEGTRDDQRHDHLRKSRRRRRRRRDGVQQWRRNPDQRGGVGQRGQ